jgi:hypothetical protein
MWKFYFVVSTIIYVKTYGYYFINNITLQLFCVKYKLRETSEIKYFLEIHLFICSQFYVYSLKFMETYAMGGINIYLLLQFRFKYIYIHSCKA